MQTQARALLEQVIEAATAPGLLPLGIAIAAVMLALGYFIRSHPGGDH